jgi:hypothetical protein
LWTGPNAEFSFEDPMANSSQFVLPSRAAPSADKRAHAVQSYAGTYDSRIFDPQVVRIPFVESTSFSASGTPAASELVSPPAVCSSIAFARSRARSGVGVRKACTRASTASMRASEDSTISTADISLARSLPASSVAVRSQSSVTG